MTSQELLEEFCKRRANVSDVEFPKMAIRNEIDMLTWAVQSILEKLRDNETEKTP